MAPEVPPRTRADRRELPQSAGRLVLRDRTAGDSGRAVSVVAGRRPVLGMGMDRLGRLLYAVRPRQGAGLSAGGRDPAPRLRRSRSPGSRAHRGTACAHLREDRPARRGPATPAAGGTGTAARRAARTARHGLGGERPVRRAAHREAAPGREDRAEPALPVRKREEVQEVLRHPGTKLILYDGTSAPTSSARRRTPCFPADASGLP